MISEEEDGKNHGNQIDYIQDGFLEFRELRIFTEAAAVLLSDFEFAKLQRDLMQNPFAGDVIRATGGARKLRVGLRGVGKRGGGRVVYYYQAGNVIHLLLLYRKSAQENLSPDQAHLVRAAVEWIRKGEA